MAEIYCPLSLRNAPVIYTGIETAETIKYATNAFLATKITFINQIGPKFLHAGPGYGGSCFPKDTAALARMGQEHAAPQRIVEAVIDINDARKRAMAGRILELLDGAAAGRKVAVLGVTFKPNTDDMRDSPALTIVPALIGAGARAHAVDPQGSKEGEALLPGVVWESDSYAAAEGAEAVAILTEWNEFRAVDLDRLAAVMAVPRMADLRNLYSPAVAAAAGFAYSLIGR